MTSLAYSIGKQQRGDTSISPTRKLVPGPGQYEESSEKFRKTSPKWCFGTNSRPSLHQSNSTTIVGPGRYDIPNRAVEGSKYSMSGINYFQKKSSSISPGPGAYQPRNVTDVSISYTLAPKLSLQHS